jgi:hypothetical protein
MASSSSAEVRRLSGLDILVTVMACYNGGTSLEEIHVNVDISSSLGSQRRYLSTSLGSQRRRCRFWRFWDLGLGWVPSFSLLAVKNQTPSLFVHPPPSVRDERNHQLH